MRVTPVSLLLCALLAASAAPLPAAAEDAASEAATLRELARESYDLGDYEDARAQLEEALGKLEEAGKARSAAAVRTRVLLGAVFGAGLDDAEAATEQFVQALEIDPEASLEGDLATEELEALFEEARKEVNPDCSSLQGLHHERVTEAPAGSAVKLRCRVGAGLADYQMQIFYRAPGEAEFQSAPMEAAEGCARVGEIPAEAVEGQRLQYYLAAMTEDGKIAAAEGRADAPVAISIRASAPEPGEEGSPQAEDEVPAHLRSSEPKKRGGCAGCGAGGTPAGGAFIPLLLVAAGLLVRRRNRSC